jgi:DNA-binding transcriptional regulator YhcF (GntR family)
MITIDPHSPTPPFEQLRVQLADQIASGELGAGTRLPTVRKLAEDLSLAPNTVARTYRELETDGVIETRGRHGSFVRASQTDPATQAMAAARLYADRIRQLGVSLDEGVAMARSALEA